MEFVLFRFYRRLSDGMVFRCERVKGEKALLHLACMRSFFDGHERRHVVPKAHAAGWEVISEENEKPHLETYSRDLRAEYGMHDGLGIESAIFRRQYHIDPYLSAVSDEEIQHRMDAIADNIFRFGMNGEVNLITGDALAPWRRKIEELLEELSNGREHFLLEHPEKPGLKVLRIMANTAKNNGYANALPWGGLPKPAGGQLFKFGEAKYLRPALEEGRLRITCTSFYSDAKLNSARRDGDEGRTILRPSSTGLQILFKDQSGKTIFGPAERGNKQLAVEIGGDQDFFVWCCSRTYAPRLYVDFHADSCLVIHDGKEFASRLNKGLLRKIPELQGMKGSHVRYYDPFVPDDTLEEMLSTPLSLFLFKDLRYAYQAEYRFLWPIQGKPVQSALEIEVGPLTDICELLELPISATSA